MAIVQRPLAAMLAQPSVRTPRDLEGRRVGVTGLPSDDAVLRSIVAGAGGDPDKVRPTTIGFAAVSSLLTGRVVAATGFWNAEGVALRARRPRTRVFRVEDYGAPSYPELVLTVTRETLQDEPGIVRATVAALSRGYSEVLSDPENGVNRLLAGAGGLDRSAVQRELDAVSPAFTAGARSFGELNRCACRPGRAGRSASESPSASPTSRGRSTAATCRARATATRPYSSKAMICAERRLPSRRR